MNETAQVSFLANGFMARYKGGRKGRKMQQRRILRILAVLMVVLALQTMAQATRVVGTWSTIFEGVQYATGTDDTPLMKAFAVKVDLQNPYVSLFASHDNGTAAYETALQTPPAFRDEHGLKVAVNASFYNASLSPNTDIWGLLVSNGTIVSAPDYAAPFDSYISFTSAKAGIIGSGNTVPPGCFNAVAGAEILLNNGVNNGWDSDPQPATSYGLSQDGRYMIICVVDGRQAGWSDGATPYQMMRWMLDFGAWNADKMDGGGSSCMSISGMGDYVNRPCYGYARAVGASLGILSVGVTNPPYTFDTGIMDWTPGNSSSAIYYAPAPGWPGCMYYDQLGDDCFVYSPPTNFVGSANEVITVNVYPQSGNSASHDMQIFWKTEAEDYWDAAKSSPIVNYTAQNNWAVVTLDVNNAKWTGQTIKQLRLDTDQTNHSTRWIVDYVVRGVPPVDIIMDNTAGVATGTWATGTTSTDKYGADYRYHATVKKSSSDKFTWTPTILTAGNYQVYAWWPAGTNRSTAAPYTIYYNGGNTTVNCNQQINGGVWNSLGTYNFAAGTAGYVKLGVTAPTGYNVMADAVRFVKQ